MGGLLIHEWISRSGGSEKVLDAMAAAFPSADIFCLWNDAKTRYRHGRVSESWLAQTPLRRHKALALLAMPGVWRHLHPGDYDWALISSHLFAHQARVVGPSGSVPKLVYAHTPARYIWNAELDTRGKGLAARTLSPGLRWIDRRKAQEPIAIAANSKFVRDRIRVSWDRDAQVIYPPVAVEHIRDRKTWVPRLSETDLKIIASLPSFFFLGASRFVEYKKLDEVIDVGARSDVPVVIAGSGPLEMFLRQKAKESRAPVKIIANPSDALLYALFERAALYIFPAVEDFGIMPVEAMAVGTPVLGLSRGGVAESVIDGRTGALVESFRGLVVDGVDRALSCEAEQVRARANFFSEKEFKKRLVNWVANSLKNGQSDSGKIT